MSQSEHTARCQRWLDEQLEALGQLHNASTRDPSFKQWRQNTVTALQRIWPADSARIERFRRIPFTPSNGRTQPTIAREWYSRGCTEAEAFLQAMAREIEAVGVPDHDAAVPTARPVGSSAEEDFPVVDLPSGDIQPRAIVAAMGDDSDNVIDLGGPSSPAARAAEDATAIRTDNSDAPAPPQLRIDVPAPLPLESAPQMPARTSEPAKASEPARASEPVAEASGSARARASRQAKKAARGARLKDLLGLSQLEAKLTGEGSAAELPTPMPAPAPAPAASTPAKPAHDEAQAQVRGSFVTATPRPLVSGTRRKESLESLVPESLREAPPAPPEPAPPAPEPVASAPPPAPVAPVPPEPIAEPSEAELDHEMFERATEDFLRTSPVLGLQGKPVQRQSDATQFLDPDAVAVASLASEVARLAVAEGSRASVRAMLIELARRIDAGDLEWRQLRASVALAMEHPELARRLIPVLLPWLDRAA